MEHHRHAVFSAKDAGTWNQLDPKCYSAFKYGCASSTHFFACIVADMIADRIPLDEDWMITSAAYKKVPTASNRLLTYVLRELLHPINVVPFCIKRNEIYAIDFASLSTEARFDLIRHVQLEAPRESIRKKKIIVLDDAFVSGAHENNILKLFNQEPSEVHFFYLADLSGFNRLATEEQLNHALVKSLEDLKAIIGEGKFLLNARILKFVLGYPDFGEVHDFLTSLESNLLADMLHGAVSDGYATLPEYQLNFQLLARLAPFQEYLSPRYGT